MQQPSNYPYDDLDPFGHVRPNGRKHTGSDWAAPTGSEVYAIADGEIIASGDNAGNGLYLAQTLPDGKTWSYIHLSAQLVGLGRVRQGDVIALSGNTGTNSLGPHLHCSCAADGNPMVWAGVGALIDPYAYLTSIPPTPTPTGDNDMAQGAFYRVADGQPGAGAIYWQEKPNTAFTAITFPTWTAYAAQRNAYANLSKADIDALIKKYGLVPSPPVG